MKKLNKKGFTLIELLAVIVILAIIVVVTVPTIITTIEDARVNSIWNLAGSIANSYDTMVAQDLLASTSALGEGNYAKADWQCIGDINSGGLAEKLDLSSKDVVLTGTAPTGNIEGNTTDATCSAIRLKSNGGAEVLLIATSTEGKFSISGKKVWAVSSQETGHKQ